MSRFKVGTKFVGNCNNAEMEVIGIEPRVVGTESGRLHECNPIAVIKDLKTGKKFCYGLQALERCNVTILSG